MSLIEKDFMCLSLQAQSVLYYLLHVAALMLIELGWGGYNCYQVREMCL